jgi:hypothetical protein
MQKRNAVRGLIWKVIAGDLQVCEIKRVPSPVAN